jgi:hypothetical protein
LPLRRIIGVLLLCSSVALLAAAPPGPTPTPLPLLTPAPAASAGPTTPTVIVYPFEVQGGMDPKIGMAMAQITAQEMAAPGGLIVAPVPQGVTRSGYLDYARKQKADYYISAYVTPVGEIASVVAQLVAVDSGIIIYSQTAQVATVADVASQALVERDAVITSAHPGGRQGVAEGKETPAPTSTNGANVKLQGISGLSGIVDSVFGKHGGKPTPTPSPSPYLKPQRGVIVARVSGPADMSDALSGATGYLYTALNGYFNAQMTGVTQNVAQAADSICGANRNNTIATGTLSKVNSGGKHGKTQIAFVLSIYTCFGATLAQSTGTADTVAKAIAAAVTAYAKDHPDNS